MFDDIMNSMVDMLFGSFNIRMKYQIFYKGIPMPYLSCSGDMVQMSTLQQEEVGESLSNIQKAFIAVVDDAYSINLEQRWQLFYENLRANFQLGANPADDSVSQEEVEEYNFNIFEFNTTLIEEQWFLIQHPALSTFLLTSLSLPQLTLDVDLPLFASSVSTAPLLARE